MPPQFSKTEQDFIQLVKDTQSFTFEGNTYDILEVDKPRISKGECKTDVFIRTKQKDFKISIKQSNADFLENKMPYDCAVRIFGEDASDILRGIIHSIDNSFQNHPLICFEKRRRTEAKTMILGWKFELVNKINGEKSGALQLTNEQKLIVYSGYASPENKRNAIVNGKEIINSGVADYILEVDNIEHGNLQFHIDKLQSVAAYSAPKTVYFACKALNYRALKDKWDGDRPLAVYIDWQLTQDKQLVSTIKYDNPLQVKGNFVGNNVRSILKTLNIDASNFDELKNYYSGNTYPSIKNQ